MQSFLTWIAIALNHRARLDADIHTQPLILPVLLFFLFSKYICFPLKIGLTAVIETRDQKRPYRNHVRMKTAFIDSPKVCYRAFLSY